MLYISTENIKYSTVGATFTVTFHTPIDEIGYLQAIHDKYAEMNMSAFPLTANTADTPQTETQNSNKNSNVISVYDGVSEAVRCAMCSNPNKSDRGCDGACSYDEKLYERIMKAIEKSIADTPQTEREGE